MKLFDNKPQSHDSGNDLGGSHNRAFSASSSGASLMQRMVDHPVTYSIVVICVGLYLLSFVFDQINLQLMYVTTLPWSESYRLLTTAFLHSGLFHLAFNMMALIMLGEVLESLLGSVRFLLLYLFSAVCGNLLVGLLAGITTPTITAVVGASGAVFGVFGALLVISRKLGNNAQALLVVLGINFAFGFIVPNISWEAHLGGFLGGLVFAEICVLALRLRKKR